MIAIIAFLFSTAAFSADMSVTVKKVKAHKGQVIVHIFNSAESYMKKPFQSIIVPTSEKPSVVAQFKDLKPGSYGISVSYDENKNGELDTGMFGIPKEPYGFSNNAQPSFGPPSFDKAVIQIDEGNNSTEIDLIY